MNPLQVLIQQVEGRIDSLKTSIKREEKIIHALKKLGIEGDLEGGQPTKRNGPGEIKAAVLDVFSSGQPLTIEQAFESLGFQHLTNRFTKSRFRMELFRLAKAGHLQRVSIGVYQLTPSPESLEVPVPERQEELETV